MRLNCINHKCITALFFFVKILNAFSQVPDDFPEISVSKTGETAPGYVFLTVSADVEGTGYYLFMIDDTGTPFKYKKLEHDFAYDFKVQPNGLLSYARFLSHHTYTGGGNCIHMVLDKNMNPVDSFRLGNGYIAEAHDFQLLPNGHALVFGYYLTQMDLSDLVDGGYPNAMVSGGIVQELDQDKKVVWQWRSWDHYDPEEYAFGNRANLPTVSEFHLNTINLDTDGHLFLGTPDWTKKINRQTGSIMWHLGGWENEFSFVGVDSLEGVEDVTGHAFHRLGNGNVLIYDNGPREGEGTSEAHEYRLDEENMIAEKIRSFTPSENIPAWHRGNAQRLPNGNTLVGWGGASGKIIPACTEFDPSGNIVFEVFFDNPLVESYRAFRFPYPPVPKYDLSEFELSPGSTYEFLQGDTLYTGIKVKVIDLVSVGYSELLVTVYDNAPEFPEFEDRAPKVLPIRVVMDKYSINYIDGNLIFDTQEFKFNNPGDITVYYRPTEGSGVFNPIPTDYNPVTKMLSGTFDGFGEFILTSPDLDHQVFVPVPSHPKNNQQVNFKLPVLFEWSQNGFFNNFALQVSTDESFNHLLINEPELGSTIYELDSLPVNTDYYWRVKMTNDAGESDWSETASFTTRAPYLELTVPNGNEVWNRGNEYFIEWSGNAAGRVILDLYRDRDLLFPIDTVENNGAYLWTLPAGLDSACNYSVSITSREDPAIHDCSDETFAINDSSCTGMVVPYIRVTSPNGGEIADKSEAFEITWENTTGEPVNVELFKNGEFTESPFSDINENRASWTIPGEIENADDYRIVVTSTGATNLSDTGNADFTIKGYPQATNINKPAYLTIYPNPADRLLTIQTQTSEIEDYHIMITDYTGRVILDSNRYSSQIDVSGYPAGLYFIKIKIDGETHVGKVIIE